MEQDIDISEIKLIIRNLIAFIVVEGKQYVSDAKKKEYVYAYLQLLIKTIHLVEEEKISVIEDIADDISTFIK